MAIPESIPEDEKETYACECGGDITKNEDGLWECDSCDWKPGDNKKDKTNKTNELLAEKLTLIVGRYITVYFRELGFESKADLYTIILETLNNGIEI